MKKIFMITVTVLLVVFVVIGCTQREETVPQPTPTSSVAIEPTPNPTATPEPEPIHAILQEVTETTKFEIPETYDVVVFEDDVKGKEAITYTIYSFEDKEEKVHYRAYGFRTQPISSEKFDEGIYSIEVANGDLDGEKSVAVAFDMINAMPVDLTKEKDLYVEKKETQKKDAQANNKKAEKPKSEGSSKGSVKPQAESQAEIVTQAEVQAPTVQQAPPPQEAPVQAPQPQPPAPETNPAPTGPGEHTVSEPVFDDIGKDFITGPPPPPPDSW